MAGHAHTTSTSAPTRRPEYLPFSNRYRSAFRPKVPPSRAKQGSGRGQGRSTQRLFNFNSGSAPACWTISGPFARHSCWTFSFQLLDFLLDFRADTLPSLLPPCSVREGEPVTGLQFEPSPGLLDDCSAFLFCTLAGHFRVSCWASSLENFRAGTLALPLHPRSVREGEPVTGL